MTVVYLTVYASPNGRPQQYNAVTDVQSLESIVAQREEALARFNATLDVHDFVLVHACQAPHRPLLLNVALITEVTVS